MAGISQDKMMEIINRSRTLCNPNGDRLIESKGGNSNGGMYGSYDDFDDSIYLAETTDNCARVPDDDFDYDNSTVMRSNLPDNIKQSMMSKRINQNDLKENSFLDKMGQNYQQQKSQIRETRQTQYAPVTNSGVDYTALKAIMKECLNEYFANQPLNENSLKQIGLGENKIKLVDNQGRVYEANLSYKGTLKKK